MKKIVDVTELEDFLWYLQDKSDEAFEDETKQAVKRFLEDIKEKS